MTDLDRLLEQVADEPAEGELTTMEAEVWAAIDQDRRYGAVAPVAAYGAVQALRSPIAAVLSALLIGAAIGAISLQSASQGGPMSAFSASAPNAPSTLLAGPRG